MDIVDDLELNNIDFAEIDEIEQTFISNSNNEQAQVVTSSSLNSSSSISRSPLIVSKPSNFNPKSTQNNQTKLPIPKNPVQQPLQTNKAQANIHNYFSKTPIMPVFYPQPSQPPDPIGKHQIDIEAAKSYISYQLSIVKTALFTNTLVCLPTGLGKTFIAAVVMYNFYRWFPTGKIIFLAHTKPLVAQQVEACHYVMGIPDKVTAELQGNVLPSQRRKLWKERRIFYCTPQSFKNDLDQRSCDPSDFVCVIIDEAHKATGKFAYVTVIRELLTHNPNIRIVGLSATPGSDNNRIQSVIDNLNITKMEVKTEEDYDVKGYINEKLMEPVIVKMDKDLTSLKDDYMRLMTPVVNYLTHYQVLWEKNPARLTKGIILECMNHFNTNPPPNSIIPQEKVGEIHAYFGLLMRLVHVFGLFDSHGLNSFILAMENLKLPSQPGKKLTKCQQFLINSVEYEQLLNKAKFFANSSASHPKMIKLLEIINEHFNRMNFGKEDGKTSDTKVIIFSQYRDSVSEIMKALEPLKPLIKPSEFIGQSTSKSNTKGQSQKEQHEVMMKFRNGLFNTLVATCIGEEGLDVGEVDLIICYDVVLSPIRSVQRFGRTGRKRSGKVIMLISQGPEYDKYTKSQVNAKKLMATLKKGMNRFKFHSSPRMLPDNIIPQIIEMELNIEEYQYSQVGGHNHNTNNNNKDNIQPAFLRNNNKVPMLIDDDDDDDENDNINTNNSNNNLKEYLNVNNAYDKQCNLQKTFMVNHSKKSHLLVLMSSFISNDIVNVKYPKEKTDKWIANPCTIFDSKNNSILKYMNKKKKDNNNNNEAMERNILSLVDDDGNDEENKEEFINDFNNPVKVSDEIKELVQYGMFEDLKEGCDSYQMKNIYQWLYIESKNWKLEEEEKKEEKEKVNNEIELVDDDDDDDMVIDLPPKSQAMTRSLSTDPEDNIILPKPNIKNIQTQNIITSSDSQDNIILPKPNPKLLQNKQKNEKMVFEVIDNEKDGKDDDDEDNKPLNINIQQSSQNSILSLMKIKKELLSLFSLSPENDNNNNNKKVNNKDIGDNLIPSPPTSPNCIVSYNINEWSQSFEGEKDRITMEEENDEDNNNDIQFDLDIEDIINITQQQQSQKQQLEVKKEEILQKEKEEEEKGINKSPIIQPKQEECNFDDFSLLNDSELPDIESSMDILQQQHNTANTNTNTNTNTNVLSIIDDDDDEGDSVTFDISVNMDDINNIVNKQPIKEVEKEKEVNKVEVDNRLVNKDMNESIVTGNNNIALSHSSYIVQLATSNTIKCPFCNIELLSMKNYVNHLKDYILELETIVENNEENNNNNNNTLPRCISSGNNDNNNEDISIIDISDESVITLPSKRSSIVEKPKPNPIIQSEEKPVKRQTSPIRIEGNPNKLIKSSPIIYKTPTKPQQQLLQQSSYEYIKMEESIISYINEIYNTLDLDTMTVRRVREICEEHFNTSLEEYRQTIQTCLRKLISESPSLPMKNKNQIKKCLICHKSDNNNNNEICLFECTKCGITVHNTCYGIDNKTQSNIWLCDICKYIRDNNNNINNNNSNNKIMCIFCGEMNNNNNNNNNMLNVMKLSADGYFTHIECSLWINKVKFSDDYHKIPININDILNNYNNNNNNNNNRNVCEICKKSTGICRKCDFDGCNHYYHIKCGWYNGYYFKENIEVNNQKVYISYCLDHKPINNRISKHPIHKVTQLSSSSLNSIITQTPNTNTKSPDLNLSSFISPIRQSNTTTTTTINNNNNSKSISLSQFSDVNSPERDDIPVKRRLKKKSELINNNNNINNKYNDEIERPNKKIRKVNKGNEINNDYLRKFFEEEAELSGNEDLEDDDEDKIDKLLENKENSLDGFIVSDNNISETGVEINYNRINEKLNKKSLNLIDDDLLEEEEEDDNDEEEVEITGEEGKGELSLIDDDDDDDDLAIHEGIKCSNCNMNPIKGPRYKCTECDNYNLCEKCYDKNNHEESHEFDIFDSPEAEFDDISYFNRRKQYIDDDDGEDSDNVEILDYMCDNLKNNNNHRYYSNNSNNSNESEFADTPPTTRQTSSSSYRNPFINASNYLKQQQQNNNNQQQPISPSHRIIAQQRQRPIVHQFQYNQSPIQQQQQQQQFIPSPPIKPISNNNNNNNNIIDNNTTKCAIIINNDIHQISVKPTINSILNQQFTKPSNQTREIIFPLPPESTETINPTKQTLWVNINQINGEIINELRKTGLYNLDVRSFNYEDIIVSQQLVILRRNITKLDINKVGETLLVLNQKYKKVVLILEKKDTDPFVSDKKIDITMIQLLSYPIQLFFSYKLEDTIRLINDICKNEMKNKITVPFPRFHCYYYLYNSPLNVVYISILLNKMVGRTLADVINLKESDYKRLLPDMSDNRIKRVIEYFNHHYN